MAKRKPAMSSIQVVDESNGEAPQCRGEAIHADQTTSSMRPVPIGAKADPLRLLKRQGSGELATNFIGKETISPLPCLFVVTEQLGCRNNLLRFDHQ
jgi:hypothetical protein